MVRGSLTKEEQDAWNRVLGLGFAVVIGGSATLMALFNGATLVETAGVSAGGLVVGLGLVYYLSTLSMDTGRDPDWKRER